MARSFRTVSRLRTIMALVYLFLAGLFAWQTIQHSDRETAYFKQICEKDNFQNNVVLEHPIIMPVVKPFINNKKLSLPSVEESEDALGSIPDLVMSEEDERTAANIWSWSLLGWSLIYVILTVIWRHRVWTDPLPSALTLVSVVFFIVGITAPAMVFAVLSPSNPVVSSFVLDYSTRSILGVIGKLYSTSHWLIAGCLTLFSLIVPVTKAALTVFAAEAASAPTRAQIDKLLHWIGKWSMADVFVAAIILANFAIKADESKPQTNLVIGFYYFLGYCLLSMVTTMLLTVSPGEKPAENK